MPSELIPEPCPLCHGERWICEAHRDMPHPHADCAGPGEPCPICNAADVPDMPTGYVSIARTDGSEHRSRNARRCEAARAADAVMIATLGRKVIREGTE